MMVPARSPLALGKTAFKQGTGFLAVQDTPRSELRWLPIRLPRKSEQMPELVNAVFTALGARDAMLIEGNGFEPDVMERLVRQVQAMLHTSVFELTRIAVYAGVAPDALFIRRVNDFSRRAVFGAKQRQPKEMGEVLGYICPGDTGNQGATKSIHYSVARHIFLNEMATAACFAEQQHAFEAKHKRFQRIATFLGLSYRRNVKTIVTAPVMFGMARDGDVDGMFSSRESIAAQCGELGWNITARLFETATMRADWTRTWVAFSAPIRAVLTLIAHDLLEPMYDTDAMMEFDAALRERTGNVEAKLYEMFSA